MPRILVWVLAFVGALVAVGAYSRTHQRTVPGPRLVMLYAPCTVNRSYLSPYNPAVPYTPALGAFARDGVVFTKHHTEEGWSGIAYAALFSGSQAMRHGVYSHPSRLDDSLYLIAEAYRDNGYEAFMWTYHGMASPELNYAQGVEPANTFWIPKESRQPKINNFLHGDDPHFLKVLARLRDDPTYKAFIITNFTVTHMPYMTDSVDAFCELFADECLGLTREEISKYAGFFHEKPFAWEHTFDQMVKETSLSPPEVANFARALELLYKSNIWHLDQIFGAVLESIKSYGLLEQSVIAFTADHGEVLYRENAPLKWWHGNQLLPGDIVVPFIIRSPGLPAGRYDGVTRSIDVFPTLAGLSGIALPEDTVMGVDLTPALRGRAPAPALLAFTHTAFVPVFQNTTAYPFLGSHFPMGDPNSMWVAVRDGPLMYKLTSNDAVTFQPHVYDWESDPEETRDLYDPQNAHHAAMVDSLSSYKTALLDGYRRVAGKQGLPTERQQEILRSLGYIQ